MTERRPFNEMPEKLKNLVRYVTVAFYSVECQLVMEFMSFYRRVSEDDMCKLLQFDKKQLRSALNILKQDKFLYSRNLMETGTDNKSTKLTYYYVDYGVFINVVKYKLHQIRIKVQAMERDATSRAAFHCPNCYKNYTDLEAGQLFDCLSQTFKCTYCFTEVEEDKSKDGTGDSRKVMAVFNEQMQPIFDTIKILDQSKLADVLLEPPPVKDSKNSKLKGDKINWSGELTRNSGKEEFITISDSKQHKIAKEMPKWVKTSAIEDASDQSDAKAMQSNETIVSPAKETSSIDKELIMKTLLSHERRAPLSETQSERVVVDRVVPKSSLGESDEEEMSDDDDGDFTVTLSGKRVAYNDITADMVAGMTEYEKEEYIRVGREMHEYYE